MSRVDRPALKCDRCKFVTEDTALMMRFMKLENPHMSGSEKWDLCVGCASTFRKFMEGDPA